MTDVELLTLTAAIIFTKDGVVEDEALSIAIDFHNRAIQHVRDRKPLPFPTYRGPLCSSDPKDAA